jgi:hypothetical protein
VALFQPQPFRLGQCLRPTALKMIDVVRLHGIIFALLDINIAASSGGSEN